MLASKQIKLIQQLIDKYGDFNILTMADCEYNQDDYVHDNGKFFIWFELGYLPTSLCIDNNDFHAEFGVSSGKPFWENI